MLLVEPGSTGSVIRCVPDRTTRVHVLNGMLNRYKEKKIISTDLGKISSNFSASLCVQNVFLFGQVTNFMNQRYKIHDVTVFAMLIQISFKLIHGIDRFYQIF